MVDAKELRIGNYVYSKSTPKSINQEDNVISIVCMVRVEDCDDYSPIPLTEEILLKCGFELERGELVLNIPNCGNWNWQLYEYEDCVEIQVQDEYSTYSHNIKHLHQLQNLYFALTGEELNVTL